MVYLFGYGSLINKKSLHSTVPDARNLKPAWLYNYKRTFNLTSTTRFCELHQKYISVLNIEKNNNESVNGILFELPDERVESLQKREGAYIMKQAEITGYNGKIYKAYIFIGNNKYQKFFRDSPKQLEYLQICISGAENFGKNFKKDFLSTTYIENRPLWKYIN